MQTLTSTKPQKSPPEWQAITEVIQLLRPPARLTVAEWADKERKLSPESSAEPGDWYTDRAEYQRGIMEAFSDPHTERIVVMSSAQIGKTEMVNNVVGFYITQNPSPILVVQPNLDVAKAWSKDRLAPMLRDTPCLKGKVRDVRSRDSGNTTLHKLFTGGHITITGAESPAGLASRPIRVVLCDEVDRYPYSAGTEGDPVDLAIKRATTFWNRKIGMFSTPTIKDHSRIETAYKLSDQRKFWVPCPHCGEFQILKWQNVKWPAGQPALAHYECGACGASITDADKIRMVRKGEWRSENETHGIAGFWINELYSPWVSFGNMAVRFVEAKHKGREALQVFINTALAETFEEQETVDLESLKGKLIARREDYGETVPMGAAIVDITVDIQDDRAEITVKAYGADRESWGITHELIYGNPEVRHPGGLWDQLDAFLMRTWQHESGAVLTPLITFVDSGYLSKVVYEFTKPRFNRNIFATKGSSEPKHELVSKITRKNASRCPLFFIGTNEAKSILFSRMMVDKPGPGYMHWNKRFDEEYFKQLVTSETARWHKGAKIWEKRVKGEPNESLDLEAMSIAACEKWLAATGMDLNAEVARLAALVKQAPAEPEQAPAAAGEKEEEPEAQEPEEEQRQQRRRPGWVTGWKRR